MIKLDKTSKIQKVNRGKKKNFYYFLYLYLFIIRLNYLGNETPTAATSQATAAASKLIQQSPGNILPINIIYDKKF